MTSDAMIEVHDLRKVYRVGDERVVALDHIDLEVRRGEICCIFGESGSGKSTLLNMLAGLDKPTKGQIVISGVDIAKLSERQMAAFRQKHIGFIFQAYNLLPYLTAEENVALPLIFHGVSERKRRQIAIKLLDQVGLKKRLHHYPTQMSGGQQQRVGIARAFAADPDVIFADEPTGNLDSKTTAQIIAMIAGLVKEKHQTLVMVSHDPEMAAYADRIVTLIDGAIVDVQVKDKQASAPPVAQDATAPGATPTES